MSTAFPARTATRAAPASGRAGVRATRPRLTVVDDRPFKPPRMPFVLFVVVLLGAGLIGLGCPTARCSACPPRASPAPARPSTARRCRSRSQS